MKTKIQYPLGMVVAIIFLIGCGVRGEQNTTTYTPKQMSQPHYHFVSVAIAVDLSGSGATYQVPKFDPQTELTPLIDYIIQAGSGQIAVTQISRWSDIAPAMFTIEPGRKPEVPVKPKLADYVSPSEYYRQYNIYTNQRLPEYDSLEVQYHAYTDTLVLHFWQEVDRVLSTHIDASYSDLHAALNRLGLSHESQAVKNAEHYTIVYSDGITDAEQYVPLMSSDVPITYLWVYGSQNCTISEKLEWVQQLKPTPIISMSAAIYTILHPQKN